MSNTTILLLILSVLASGALSFYQYLFSAKNKSGINLFLAFLRFISYFVVLLLLINPIISRKITEYNKTPLPIYLDNSQSILHLNGKQNQNDVFTKLKNNKLLHDKFDVQFFDISEQVESNDSLTYEGNQSRLDLAGKHANQLYKNRNYPLLLLSDGNQTQGTDFVYAFPQNAKVFPVIIGDTTQFDDVRINQVNCNKYAFLKNKFPLEIFAQYNGRKKNVQATVSVSDGKQILAKQSVSFSDSKSIQTVSLLLDANSIGLKKLNVQIQTSQLNEKNKLNNQKYVAIEVLDQRSEIALIAAINHPDIGALKRSIEANQQRKVNILKPQEVKDLTKYNLLILYQPNNTFSSLIKSLKITPKNIWILTGKSTDYNLVNSLQEFLKCNVSGQNEQYLGTFNSSFSLFAQSDIGFSNFPPLENAFGTVKSSVDVSVLLNATINNVAVNQPLWCFAETTSQRMAFLLGENIWKWRMESYAQSKSFLEFDLLIDKTIQFLISDNQRKSLLVSHENIYNTGDAIEIIAQHFNKNYEFNENALLTLSLTNKQTNANKTYDFSKGNSEYKIVLDNLNAGKYDFVVTEQNTKVSQKGSFEIVKFDIEKQFVNADAVKMTQLATNNNGNVYFSDSVDKLITSLLTDTNYKIFEKEVVKKTPLIDWKQLLILVLVFLSLEWFIRKYNGLL